MRLNFTTIAALSKACGHLDVLILLALGMDAQRNEVLYSDPSYRRIDDLLDDDSWRLRWEHARSRREKFSSFIVREFIKKMSTIGYIPPSPDLWKGIRPGGARRFLYHLILLSKNEKGYIFWREALKYAEKEKQLRFGL